MKCKKVQEMISLYLDNKLSSSEKEQFEQHLDSCSACKKEYIYTRNIKDLLSGLKAVNTISDGFTDSVMDKIKNKTYDKQEDKAVVLKFIKKHLLVAASFIFVVLASSSVFLMRDTNSVNINQIINQNKVQTEVKLKSALRDNAYYVSIIESFFDNNSHESDDDIEEEYILSFFA